VRGREREEKREKMAVTKKIMDTRGEANVEKLGKSKKNKKKKKKKPRREMQKRELQLAQRLMGIDPGDYGRFSFEGKRIVARITSAYDGDTVTACFLWHKEVTKRSVRLVGIDTCEVARKSQEEIAMGKEAQRALAEMCLDKIVVLDCGKNGKYGRVLARILCFESTPSLFEWLKGGSDDLIKYCANDELLRLGYAIEYDGKSGAKRAFQMLGPQNQR
jgi:endonuclease YncB( thermonuclease family)